MVKQLLMLSLVLLLATASAALAAVTLTTPALPTVDGQGVNCLVLNASDRPLSGTVTLWTSTRLGVQPVSSATFDDRPPLAVTALAATPVGGFLSCQVTVEGAGSNDVRVTLCVLDSATEGCVAAVSAP